MIEMANAVYNKKMEKIRENNGKTDYRPEDLTEKDIEKAMYVYGILLRDGHMRAAKVETLTGWSGSIVHNALHALLDMGLVSRTQEADVQGKPWRYAPIANGKLPEGYSKESCVAMENPVRPEEQPRAVAQEARAEKVRDNPLTRALAKKDISIPEDSLASYMQAAEEIGRLHYGIKEIDDIIDALSDLVRERCRNVDRQCPICHGKLKASGTAAVCQSKRCGASADSKKSFELSVRMLTALADMKD